MILAGVGVGAASGEVTYKDLSGILGKLLKECIARRNGNALTPCTLNPKVKVSSAASMNQTGVSNEKSIAAAEVKKEPSSVPKRKPLDMCKRESACGNNVDAAGWLKPGQLDGVKRRPACGMKMEGPTGVKGKSQGAASHSGTERVGRKRPRDTIYYNVSDDTDEDNDLLVFQTDRAKKLRVESAGLVEEM
jgi:hypothetical protein